MYLDATKQFHRQTATFVIYHLELPRVQAAKDLMFISLQVNQRRWVFSSVKVTFATAFLSTKQQSESMIGVSFGTFSW